MYEISNLTAIKRLNSKLAEDGISVKSETALKEHKQILEKKLIQINTELSLVNDFIKDNYEEILNTVAELIYADIVYNSIYSKKIHINSDSFSIGVAHKYFELTNEELSDLCVLIPKLLSMLFVAHLDIIVSIFPFPYPCPLCKTHNLFNIEFAWKFVQ